MPVSRTRRSQLLGGFLAAASACTVAALAPHAAAAPSRHPLPGSTPKWLGHARLVATAPGASRIGFGVLLGLRDADKIDSRIQALTDPHSASYGQWLTNAQFNAEYAPAPANVRAVASWLTGQGFTVGKTLPSGQYLSATGTAAQIEKTFGTDLGTYELAGKKVLGNANGLSLPSDTPAAVVSAVAGVLGLDQGAALKKPADTEPPGGPGGRYGVQPCSDYFGQKIAATLPPASGKKQPYAVCGYTPSQLESAYGLADSIKAGVDGHGITVAVTDAYASPTIAYDVAKYNQLYALPAFEPGQFSQIIPGSDDYTDIGACGASGWYGEETLDIEAVHTMAPGAKIVYVGAKNCGTTSDGLDYSWASTIDNHVADVITDSWTDYFDDPALLGQDYIAYYNQFSQEAALTGISVLFSTGDSGDHTNQPCNTQYGKAYCTASTEFPADSPYVVAVGGSSLEIGSAGQRLGEFGWSNAYSTLTNNKWDQRAYSSGGGGGTSQIWKQPFYQKGVVPNSTAKANRGQPMRTTPDVAMLGDPNTGLRVGQTQIFPDGTYWDTYRIGGTSLASPLMAGVLAVAGQASHHAIGFANPVLYSLVGTPAVHDLVAPTSPVYQVRTDYTDGFHSTAGLSFKLQYLDDQSSTLHDAQGWDNETGIGSPSGSAFLAAVSRLGSRGHGH